eukprot:TRINITY_DN3829_c0_g2_i2.p1 TRINITY_DN3829_c0_g2~~TRINITY_DN3829_c0_g2_i2.p1  ORF type:complete len:294 (+),score=68.10 TRINITY_DN3829_c0_g2_i2:149-1030(+)
MCIRDRAMASEMCHKQLEEVMDWLRTTLGTHDISFEVNPQTLAIMYAKMKQSQTAASCAEESIVALKESRSEYRAESERMQKLLRTFGVSTGDKFLSKSGTTSLAQLSLLANQLSLNDVSTGTYMMTIQDQIDELDRAKLETIHTRRENVHLTSVLSETNASLVLVEGKLEDWEQRKGDVQQALEMKHQALNHYFGAKKNEYKSQIAQAKASIQQAGYKPEFEHTALVETGRLIEVEKAQVVELEAKLSGFKSLPPDMQLAQVEVERTRMVLQELRNKLGQFIDDETENFNPR